MFGARANEFREACYALFGYRVDMDSAAAAPRAPAGTPPPGTTFTLKPMHADDARVSSLCALSEGVLVQAKNDVDMSGDGFDSAHMSDELEARVLQLILQVMVLS